MNDLTTSLILQLRNSQFSSGLRSSTRDVERFSQQSRREVRALKESFKNMTGHYLGDLKRDLVAVGSTWAIINQSKRSGQLEKDLTRISQTAGAARDKTSDLKKELFLLQRQYGVTIDSSKSAMDSLVQSGLSWDQALGGTKAIAPATAVTGANPQVLASALGVSGEIYGFDLANLKTAKELLDKMTVAGRQGNAELEDLSGIVSKVGANAHQAGFSFDQMLGFVEQLSLTQKQPEVLGTLVDSTLRTFTNQQYMKSVTQSLGVQFFDKNGARRNPFDVLGDVAKIYQRQKTDAQRQAVIAAGWGQADLDTQKGIKAILAPGAIEAWRSKTDVTSTAKGALDADLKDAIDNSIDQVSRLKGALSEAADSFIQPLNAGIDAAVKKLLNPKEAGGWGLNGTDLVLGGGAALATGVGAYKFGGPLMKKLLGKFGNVAGGVATGKALEAATGVIPVYVVNMPSSGPSLIDDLIGKGGKRTPKIPKLPDLSSVDSIIETESKAARVIKTASKFAGRAAPLAAGAYDLYGTWSGNGSMKDKITNTAGVAGGMAGTYGGGALGASLGTMLMPGIGTAIGGAIGGIGGYFAGEAAVTSLAKKIEGYFSSDKKEKKSPTLSKEDLAHIQSSAELKVTVEDKRTRVTSVKASPGMNLDIAGNSMAMGGM